MSFDKHKPQVK